MNPTLLLRLSNAKNTFNNNHPKLASFINKVYCDGVEEGEIIEITVTKTSGEVITSNIKVKKSDLELFDILKEISK